MRTINTLKAVALAAAVALSPSVLSAQETETPTGEAQTPTEAAQDAAIAAMVHAASKILAENAKAAGRESGEIDKLLRAISGVSVEDIRKYGLCGGPNSEVRKHFASLCSPI